MAFTNYADLKAAVESWIDREEDAQVVDRIPDFIRFGEEAIFRRLRSRLNEAKATYTTDTAQGILLPQDYREAKYVLWDGRKLTRKSDQWFFEQDPSGQAQERPVYYARTEATLIEFYGPPDNDAEVVLYYYYAQAPISDTFIPPLYTESPKLYLFGALVEALPFLEAPPADSDQWERKFQEALIDLQTESEDEEYSGGTVEVSGAYPDGQLRDTGTRSIY